MKNTAFLILISVFFPIHAVIAPWYHWGLTINLNKNHQNPHYQDFIKKIKKTSFVGGPWHTFVASGLRYNNQDKKTYPTGKIVTMSSGKVFEPYVELITLKKNAKIDNNSIVAFIDQPAVAAKLFNISCTADTIVVLRKIGTEKTWEKIWMEDQRINQEKLQKNNNCTI